VRGEPEVVLRGAGPADRAAVHALVRDAYREFEPFLAPAHWQRMSANLAAVVDTAGAGRLLVAELAGRPAGTVTYLAPDHPDYDHVPQDWAVIRALAVAPQARGRGVGRALTAECLRRARADAAPAVGLHTAEMMTAARTLYEGAGFAVQREFPHLGVRFLVYRLLM
jgi:ribosomal protein S18 acetylase RimI-like enzyme